MTDFHPESVEVSGKVRNGVRFKLKGTQTWREGKYTNERNTTETIVVSEARAKKIRDDLDEMLK